MTMKPRNNFLPVVSGIILLALVILTLIVVALIESW